MADSTAARSACGHQARPDVLVLAALTVEQWRWSKQQNAGPVFPAKYGGRCRVALQHLESHITVEQRSPSIDRACGWKGPANAMLTLGNLSVAHVVPSFGTVPSSTQYKDTFQEDCDCIVRQTHQGTRHPHCSKFQQFHSCSHTWENVREIACTTGPKATSHLSSVCSALLHLSPQSRPLFLFLDLPPDGHSSSATRLAMTCLNKCGVVQRPEVMETQRSIMSS
jgi:hypothetical protein